MISASSRARAAPRQWCGPAAKDRCLRAFGRVMSSRSGSVNTAGSRLAPASISETGWPAGSTVPSISRSAVGTRELSWIGGSNRSNSSTAPGTRS